ncbi:MAG: hypothetical protein ABIR18_09800 [Chitinophagaceae bacterium]
MKHFLTLLVLSFIFQAMYAQPFSQIRLKTGASLLIPPTGRGYAYRPAPNYGGSVLIGGEFSHPLKNKKGAWQVGFTFQDGQMGPSPNFKNIVPRNLLAQPGDFNFIFSVAPAKTVIYGGFERYIKRDYLRPSKNYFSVVGGAGLAFTLNKLNDWKYSKTEKYATRDGGVVEGYTSNLVRPKFPIAPSLYGGLRYNINNKKGREVVIIELLFNYGLSSYYRQTIDYTLDGVQKRDVLKEKGMNIQLNVIVPLYSFHKKRKVLRSEW